MQVQVQTLPLLFNLCRRWAACVKGEVPPFCLISQWKKVVSWRVLVGLLSAQGRNWSKGSTPVQRLPATATRRGAPRNLPSVTAHTAHLFCLPSLRDLLTGTPSLLKAPAHSRQRELSKILPLHLTPLSTILSDFLVL